MHEIIAVTADVKRDRLTEEATPEIYLPYAPMNITSPYYALRVAGDPAYLHQLRPRRSRLDR